MTVTISEFYSLLITQNPEDLFREPSKKMNKVLNIMMQSYHNTQQHKSNQKQP